MIEITFTEKFRKFDSSMVGKTAFETDSVAENLLRKGFAIKKDEYAQLKDENYISHKGLRLCNNIIKNKIKTENAKWNDLAKRYSEIEFPDSIDDIWFAVYYGDNDFGSSAEKAMKELAKKVIVIKSIKIM